MPCSMIVAVLIAAAPAPDNDSSPDYQTQVAPLLKEYCAGRHNDEDREGKFSLETYASLQKGTKHGPALLPGDPNGSLLLRVMTGAAKPAMPPKEEPRPMPTRSRSLKPGSPQVPEDPRGPNPTDSP